MKQKTPYVLLVVATLFWGGNFVMGRGFTGTMPPFTLSFFRWVIAFLCFAPFAWKELIQHTSLWKEKWKTILIMVVTGIAGFNTLVYIAVHDTTSINATLVNSTSPAFITLFSFLFIKERLALRHYIGIVFSIIGVIWIMSRGSFETLASFSFNKGELIMIIAVTVWSIYSVIVKKNSHVFPSRGVFLLTMALGIIILFPLMLLELQQPNVEVKWSLSAFVGLLYLGACASIISFVCWNKAVADIGPGKASPFLNLIPVFASIFAIFFLGEKIQQSQIIGGLIVILGVLITSNVIKIPSKHQNNMFQNEKH